MIRFAVIPGWVTSVNDWDRHYVDAATLMRLYRVSPRECVVVRDEDGLCGIDLSMLLVLEPRVGHPGIDYHPVTQAERERYPIMVSR